MSVYCVDDRHGVPCPQPPQGDHCDACVEDECDPTATVEADTPKEAMRLAGWSDEYIASVERLLTY